MYRYGPGQFISNWALWCPPGGPKIHALAFPGSYNTLYVAVLFFGAGCYFTKFVSLGKMSKSKKNTKFKNVGFFGPQVHNRPRDPHIRNLRISQ